MAVFPVVEDMEEKATLTTPDSVPILVDFDAKVGSQSIVSPRAVCTTILCRDPGIPDKILNYGID